MTTKPRGAAGRRRGVVSVEAAFVFPVLIIAAMVVMELANVALTIDMGEVALQRAVQQFRRNGAPDDEGEDTLRSAMADASQGYLTKANISTVSIERFDSLDAMGSDSEEEDEEDEDQGKSDFSRLPPAWRITVDIRKGFITPLPHMLLFFENEFHYRFEQVLSYLPNQED